MIALVRATPKVISVCVAAFACAVFLLWISGAQGRAITVHVMKPNAAFAIACAAVALGLLSRWGSAQRLQLRIARFLAGVTFLIGLLTAWEYLFGWDLGIDLLFAPDPDTQEFPGRMAPNTAAGLVLLGAALLLMDRKTPGGHYPSAYLASLTGLIGGMALLGYLYQSVALYQLSERYFLFTPHTAVGFLLLSIGVLAARPERQPAHLLISGGAGGHMARSLLVPVFFIPISLGWIIIIIRYREIVDRGTGYSLLVTGIILLFCHLIWRNGYQLNRLERDRLAVREQGELELRESELRFRQLADSMPQVVFTARADGRIDYFNERWYQFTASDRRGTGGGDWLSMLHPEDAAPYSEAWSEALRSGKPYQAEIRLHDRRTGGFRWFLARAVPARNEKDEIVKWFGAITDIDDQKRVQDDLRILVRSRDEFLAIASHELRTPLTSLLLQAQAAGRLLDREGSATLSPERTRKLIDHTERHARRLARLIEDMLDIARIRSGTLSLVTQEFDLGDVVKDVVERLKPQLLGVSKGAPPRVSLDPGIIGRWDRPRMEQLVTNLLTNAIQYGSGKLIELELRKLDGGGIRLLVRDHGIGIAKGDQARIFDRFERAISASEVSGLGLGLFICQRIAEAHGGRIWVESELGQGSTFIVELPREPQATVA